MKTAILVGVAVTAGILFIINFPTLSAYLTLNNNSALEECKNLGIPEFTCTEDAIFAKKQLIESSDKTTVITATRSQLEECKNLGIPEFTCNQDQIDAKKKLISSQPTYTQVNNKELLEECKQLGIPEFVCTEKAILEKKS